MSQQMRKVVSDERSGAVPSWGRLVAGRLQYDGDATAPLPGPATLAQSGPARPANPPRPRRWALIAGGAAMLLLTGWVLIGYQPRFTRLVDSRPQASSPVMGEAQAVLGVELPASQPAQSPIGTTAEDKPQGRPIDPTRLDWVITQDNAEHWQSEGISGLDFAYNGNHNAFGSPIHASQRGVAYTFKDRADGTGLGNGVYILGYIDPTTGRSYNTVYGHFQKVLVTDGQAVERGTVLGEMGSTGFSTGPHLHYEVWQGQRPIATLATLKPGEVNHNVAEATRVDPEPYTK